MNIFDAIGADIGRVFGAVYRDAILFRDKPSGSDVSSFEPAPTDTTPDQYPCKAMVDAWSAGYLMRGLVKEKDVRIFIPRTSLSVEPLAGDRITVNTYADPFSIVQDTGQPAVTTDPAKGGWIIRART